MGRQRHEDAYSDVKKLNAELSRANPRLAEACDFAYRAELAYDDAYGYYSSAHAHFSFAEVECEGGNKSKALESVAIAKAAQEEVASSEIKIMNWQLENC